MLCQINTKTPYCKPLGIVTLSDTEQGLERVVSWNHETSNVCKKLTADVEEDKEEVCRDKAEESVNLGHRGLLLKVVQGWVLRELSKSMLANGSDYAAD